MVVESSFYAHFNRNVHFPIRVLYNICMENKPIRLKWLFSIRMAVIARFCVRMEENVCPKINIKQY